MSKPIVKIRDWTVLAGRVYGIIDGKPDDGVLSRTAGIIYIETKNTIYEVGNWVPSVQPPSIKDGRDKWVLRDID